MRVFITSTPDELVTCRDAAVDVVRELGHESVLRDPVPRRGLDPVTACRRQVALADAVLAIVGWRRGPVPPVALGGDGLLPWSSWEVASAFEHDLSVMAFLTGRAFAPELREENPEAHSVMADFRGELARVAAAFDDEADFRRRLRARLREAERSSQDSTAVPSGLRLRRFPRPKLPPRPYPLLLPYAHPDLMAGRDDDLADLCRKLSLPVTVLGLHAASGTGKSSLLAGGLVPKLRAEGRPVAFVRHPAEAGLAARLIGDLAETEQEDGIGIIEFRSFVDRLVAVRHAAGGNTPVLVVDQLEDLLKDGAESRRAAAGRAALGPLLAASAQRLPGTGGSPCRWLLAYRQEYHGRLVEWLEDVLSEAREEGSVGGDSLPHDLSRTSRFAAWALRPLATPPPGSPDPVAASERVFLDAIEKPLRSGGRAFPWIFAPGHAERLARAFAEARVRRPSAPLVPELQVVLAHLLERSGEPSDRDGSGYVVVKVPDEPGELIDRALEEHLRRALDFAFPHSLQGDAATRTARTRALLVLRELADGQGRRQQGHEADALARALGQEGREVLERLSTGRTRLVLLERHGDGSWVYVLAHDRLAEVLVRIVDEGRWAGLGVDAELLGLRRFVALQSQLHESGDVEQATAVPSSHFRKIEANREVLLWTDEQRAWWRVCRERRHRERQRQVVRRAAAALALTLVALGAWTLADQRAQRRALLEEVATGEPDVAFAALDQLTQGAYEPEELLDQLRQREQPFDIFERGLGGVNEDDRAETLLRLATLALPILERAPEDPVLIASLVWALDFFAGAGPPVREPAHRERALELRDKALGPLRQSRPPPPHPQPDDPSWADIPAGTFWMGAGPEDGRDDPDLQSEFPRHPVTLSALRMMTHEVTNAEYRRLLPDHQGEDSLPACLINWYEAYTYAAWLGGRLPTEAEWEYAARASCPYAYCRRNGSEAILDEAAWWLGNSVDPETGAPTARPVMQLEPNPWGLWDTYGNVLEWSATWYGLYTETPQRDPRGPMDSSTGRRTTRGGCAWRAQEWASATGRVPIRPDYRHVALGLRVMIAE